MPKSKIMLFCNHRSYEELQYDHFKYYTKYKITPVENLTQFLSVSLDFLNKIMFPFNLNSVTDSQERLVNDFHNYIYTSDNTPDVLNTLDSDESKLSLCLYEDISLESLISLYIDGLPQSVKCINYKLASISDDYCSKVMVLFYRQLIKLHHYLPIYFASENKSIVNKLVTDIFGKHLSCIPNMTDIVAFSAQEIYHVSQTLISVLSVAQLLQRHISIITSLPKDEQKIIIDKIASASMADKIVLLNQMLKNECSNLQHSSSLLDTDKLFKVLLLDSNENKLLTYDSDSYSQRKADTLNDLQDVYNKKQNSNSAICISDHQYALGTNQHNKDIVDYNSTEILAPYMLSQQQDVVSDSNGEVTTMGTIDGSDIYYVSTYYG